jgi:putative ABC transport system permease protein
MIRNYFKTAWRSLWRNKLTSVISVVGLGFGIACFFLLTTFILNEWRYDRFHKKADRIAFVNFSYKSPSDAEPVHVAVTPTAVVPAAKRAFPEVEDGVRVYDYGNRTVYWKDKAFNEKKILMADAAFFNIFSFRFLEGHPVTALKEPHSFVISQSTAKKYFGDEPALGQILKVDTTGWQVTGVIEDVPSYSTLNFDMIGSYVTLSRSKKEEWGSANDLSYLLLKNADQREPLQRQLNDYVRKQLPEEMQAGYEVKFELVPLTRVHLYSKAAAQGNVKYLYVFGGIALLLLVIACINFTNLFTAKSVQRSSEIGLRKVLGAEKKSIFIQFMMESAVITLVALTIGILLSLLVFPLFNQLIGLELSLKVWNAFYLTLILTVLFITVSFLAGAWPALVISRFRPISALKSSKQPTGGSPLLRKSLVVFQFTISIVFIIATIVAQKQLYFIQHTNTGINRSQVVVLEGNSIHPQQLEAFKTEALKYKTIQSVSASYDSPVNIQGGYSISVAGRTDNAAMSVTAIPVDKDFVRTLGMQIVQGSNFNYTDERLVKVDAHEKRQYAFMLNETAVKTLGLSPEEAVGKDVRLNGRTGKIKAVLQDFNFASLHQLITPVVLFAEYDKFGKIMIKTSEPNANQALADIEQTFKSFYPNKPFEYHFLDDEYNQLYKTEQRTTAVLNLFSIITIIVSCLGLFGLVVFMAVQRTREIGIRKVLGATAISITVLLTKQFMQLVLIAIIIAIPIAWIMMNNWLENFAYRIHISWLVFAAASGIALLIAFVTISIEAVKAAVANPVKNLRSE